MESHKRPERLSAEECCVGERPVGVDVEGVGSWRAQRRPHGVRVHTPLVDAAAHELVSSVDGAAFNPVVVAAAATPARCSVTKNSLITASSSSSSSSLNAFDSRTRLYLGSAIAETSKEDAMEPEAKEEDERRSSTPSPEVTLIAPLRFSFFSFYRSASFCTRFASLSDAFHSQHVSESLASRSHQTSFFLFFSFY